MSATDFTTFYRAMTKPGIGAGSDTNPVQTLDRSVQAEVSPQVSRQEQRQRDHIREQRDRIQREIRAFGALDYQKPGYGYGLR